jgi:hypothetical protein
MRAFLARWGVYKNYYLYPFVMDVFYDELNDVELRRRASENMSCVTRYERLHNV